MGALGAAPYLLLGFLLASFLVVLAAAGAPLARFPAAVISMASFALIPCVVSSVRVSLRQPCSPLNWAIYLFGLQLVIIPSLMVLIGPSRETLPALPSDGAINRALLIQALAFASFSVGVRVASRDKGGEDRATGGMRGLPAAESTGFIAALLAIGVTGLFLRFPDIGAIAAYFVGKAPLPRFVSDPTGSGTVGQAVGLFFLPCLGFAFIALSCRLLGQARSGRSLSRVVSALAIAVTALGAYSLFTYNRALGFYPIFALLGAISLRKRRVGFAALLTIGAVAVSALLIVGAARDTYYRTLGNTLTTADVGPSALNATDVNRFLQVYGNGPQFLGFLIERLPPSRDLYWGRTLVASVIEPVPRVGKLVAAQGGLDIYNGLIYGNTGVKDQILSFEGELYLNFDLLGVVAGFAAFGAVMVSLHRAYLRASSLTSAYCWLYIGVWTAYLVTGGVEPIAQTALYFFAAPLLALFVNSRHNRGFGGAPVRVRGIQPPLTESTL